jgi:hypothetical protein
MKYLTMKSYLLLKTYSHPNGIWVFLHHTDAEIVASMLAEFLLRTPGQYGEVFPMYHSYSSQVPEKPDELEPGFVVGVDLAEGRTTSRFMLLRRVDTGKWYLAYVDTSTLTQITHSDCTANVRDIENKLEPGAERALLANQ